MNFDLLFWGFVFSLFPSDPVNIIELNVTVPGNGSTYFTSPTYPNKYEKDTVVTYNVTGPKGYGILVGKDIQIKFFESFFRLREISRMHSSFRFFVASCTNGFVVLQTTIWSGGLRTLPRTVRCVWRYADYVNFTEVIRGQPVPILMGAPPGLCGQIKPSFRIPTRTNSVVMELERSNHRNTREN